MRNARRNAALSATSMFLVISMVAAATVSAQHPRYLVLETPRAAVRHQPVQGITPGFPDRLRATTYSYGWFGVKPRQHWSRHFGYYRGYREWSAR